MLLERTRPMKSFMLGLIFGILFLPAAVYVYFRRGHPPVAVADTPFPWEQQIVRVPLETRLETQVQQIVPMEATPANLESGARIYRDHCAVCHGIHGSPSELGKSMYPRAPQLWERGLNGAVGVSDDPPGETHWKIANGIRLTGMPSFKGILDQTQTWQVTLLLSHADQPLPPGARNLVRQPRTVLAPLHKRGTTRPREVPAKFQPTPPAVPKPGIGKGN